MNRQDLLKEMKESVGTKDPIVFFGKMVEVFNLLFDQIDYLKNEMLAVRLNSALAIRWEAKLASDMLSAQVDVLREADKDTYFNEIAALKKAFAEDKVTQNYADFVAFWQETLGWHPFLNYK